MSINISWDEQHSDIVHLVIYGSWTWDEFYEVMETMHRQMDETPHNKIQFILDMRNGQTLPQNILSNIHSISSDSHSKSDKMMVIGAGRFPKLMFDIMARVLPQKMKQIQLVESMEEAYAILVEHQPIILD